MGRYGAGPGLARCLRVPRQRKNDLRTRLILAGGLNPDNAPPRGTAGETVRVDVSSGVEMNLESRTIGKIKEFMHAVHNATRTNAGA